MYQHSALLHTRCNRKLKTYFSWKINLKWKCLKQPNICMSNSAMSHFWKKVLGIFESCDVEFLNILEAVYKEWTVFNRYKQTIPWPVVGNLMDPEKMVFNQIVSIDLKQRGDKYIIYIPELVARYTRATISLIIRQRRPLLRKLYNFGSQCLVLHKWYKLIVEENVLILKLES